MVRLAYLNRALTNFRGRVNQIWPNRDKTSDGWIGDEEHQATNSDHNPDGDGSVDAWDMDVDGVDVWACINAALRHESIQYVIYNSRITSRSYSGGLGTWHPYAGKNPHDKHVHFNTRSSHEDSSAPWLIETEDELEPQDLWNHNAEPNAAPSWNAWTRLREGNRADARIEGRLASVEVKVDALTAATIDYDKLADAIVRRVLTGAAS